MTLLSPFPHRARGIGNPDNWSAGRGVGADGKICGEQLNEYPTMAGPLSLRHL